MTAQIRRLGLRTPRADEDSLDEATEFDDVTEDEVDEAEPPEPEPARPGRRWFGARPLVVLLVAAAVLLFAAGGWFLYRAESLRSTPAASNSALVDTGRTAEVSAAVSTALSRVFSYSYDHTDVTERAADELLRGDARTTYDKLFAQVRELAPAQKLVLTTQVVSSAVQELDGNRARLLVFLDQSATRVDRNSTSSAAAQLSVTAEDVGDHWVITGMEPR